MNTLWTRGSAQVTVARRSTPVCLGAALTIVCLVAGSMSATGVVGRGEAAPKPVQAAPTLVLVPNVGIGAVKLGMKADAAAIKKVLGKAATSSPTGDEVRLALTSGLLIVRLYQGTIVEMETTSPGVAAGKVHVGSPASVVRATLGARLKATGDSLYVVGTTSLQNQLVHTYFDLSADGSKVSSIRLGYFPWLNPCYGGPTTITGSLTGAKTWGLRGCPYIVSGQVRIPQGATLTIKAGVIVKGKDAASGLSVDGGQLLVQGTADLPVVFTSLNDQNHGAINTANGAPPKAGDWIGLQVLNSGGTLTLSHAAVYYGGAYGYRPSGLFTGSGGNPTVTVQDSLFAYNLGFGIDAGQAPVGTTIKRTAFFGNEKPLQISGAMSLDGSNTFAPAGLTPNKQNGIFLSRVVPVGGTAGGKVVWAENRTPFVIEGHVRLSLNSALEFGPGVTIKGFDTNTALEVAGGTLTANGTATQPVVFTGLTDDKHGGDTNGDRTASQPTPGAWIGLSVAGTAGTLTLKHAQIFYGGASGYLPADLTFGNGGPNLNLDVESSTFAYSAGWGLDAGYAPTTAKLIGNTFYGNKQAVQLGPALTFDTTNVFHGPSVNKQNAIFLTTGFALNQGMAATLQVTEVPYVIPTTLRVQTGGSLMIAAGVVLKGATTTSAIHVDGGTLTVQGSASAPVVMTSLFDTAHGGDTSAQGAAAKANPGDWRGLELMGATRATLDHLQVLYGGSYSYQPAGITVSGDALVTLTNSEVAQSAGHGLYLSASRVTTISNTNIHNNMGFGIDFVSKDMQTRTTQSGNTFASNTKGDLGIGAKPAAAS